MIAATGYYYLSLILDSFSSQGLRKVLHSGGRALPLGSDFWGGIAVQPLKVNV